MAVAVCNLRWCCVIGFACNAFFTCKDQFLFRACTDAVYLVSNTIWPRVYELGDRGDRVSLNALGGKWHEITHVSERMLRHLCCVFGKKKLSLREAKVYEVCGEQSEFAIVLNLNTRYGIPDPETRREIWGEIAKVPIKAADLDRYKPGRDLVSSQYWPEIDRRAPTTEVSPRVDEGTTPDDVLSPNSSPVRPRSDSRPHKPDGAE